MFYGNTKTEKLCGPSVIMICLATLYF